MDRVPHRSKNFLAFVHETRKVGPCVACGTRPWEQLHHFSDDGGMALKPSDYVVARICRECHMDPVAGRKIRAMRRDGFHKLAADYLRDAVESLSLWAAHLEAQLGEYQANGCARDELVTWLADYDGRDPAAAEAWLLAWAHRRHLNALDGMTEALAEVEKAKEIGSAQFIAERALMAWR